MDLGAPKWANIHRRIQSMDLTLKKAKAPIDTAGGQRSGPEVSKRKSLE